VILFVAAGFAGNWLFNAQILLPIAVLVGMIVAAAIPGKSCAIPKDPDTE